MDQVLQLNTLEAHEIETTGEEEEAAVMMTDEEEDGVVTIEMTEGIVLMIEIETGTETEIGTEIEGTEIGTATVTEAATAVEETLIQGLALRTILTTGSLLQTFPLIVVGKI